MISRKQRKLNHIESIARTYGKTEWAREYIRQLLTKKMEERENNERKMDC